MLGLQEWRCCCLLGLALSGPGLAPAAEDRAAGLDHYFNREFGLAVAAFERHLANEQDSPEAHLLLTKALLYQELDRLGYVGTRAFRGDRKYRSAGKAQAGRSDQPANLGRARKGAAVLRASLGRVRGRQGSAALAGAAPPRAGHSPILRSQGVFQGVGKRPAGARAQLPHRRAPSGLSGRAPGGRLPRVHRGQIALGPAGDDRHARIRRQARRRESNWSSELPEKASRIGTRRASCWQ